MAVGEATELVLAVRAKWRSGVGFLLRRRFEHRAEEFLAAAQEVFFQMAEILIGGAEGVLKFPGQTQEQRLPFGGQQGFQSVGALAGR